MVRQDMFKLMRPVLLGRLEPRVCGRCGRVYSRRADGGKQGVIRASTGRAGAILRKRPYLARWQHREVRI